MDKLRDFLKSRLGQAILLICLSPVVFMGFEGLFQGGQLAPNQLAKVGDVRILMDSVQNEATANRSRLLEAGVDGGAINTQALNAQSYNNIFSRSLLESQATTLGMYLSDEMITRLLQQDPQFLDADGKFSNDLFGQFLTSNGMTKDMLFANYRTQLNIRQLSASVLGAGILPKSQISRLIDLQTESRPVWLKRLGWQHYANQVTVSDTEIGEYYAKHKETLLSPAMVDLTVLVLDETALPEPTVSDDELKMAYQKYLTANNMGKQELAQILLTGDKAGERAKQVTDELKAGKDFAELAKAHSDDPSGQTGGNMGSFNPAVFGADASKVEQALAGLSAGQVSVPVQTAFGWQIFKVLKVSDAPTLESLKDELTKQVQDEKRQAEKDTLVATINGMGADNYALKDIATELKLTAQTLSDYPQTNNTTAFNQGVVMAAAFDDELIANQAVSGNLTVNGQTLWVEPTNHRPATPMDLTQATPYIKEILTKQKASELALADAQKLVQNFDKNQVKDFVSLGMVNRQSPMLSDAERAELFAKPATKDNLVAWAVLTDDGASVMVGGDISTEATARMGEAERKMASRMMTEIAGQDLLEDYLLYLKETIPTKTNEELLKTL